MISSPLSAQQKIAINPYISCWVEASAGTGKTKVLVDRVLALLLSGAEPEKILCLTFTKAAALEMEKRLYQITQTWSNLDTLKLKSILSHLLDSQPTQTDCAHAKALFHKLTLKRALRIQTLHAFCQFLLKSFPLESGLAPNFTVLDDNKAYHLKKLAFNSALSSLSSNRLNTITRWATLIQLESIFLSGQEAKTLAFFKTNTPEKIASVLYKKAPFSPLLTELQLKQTHLTENSLPQHLFKELLHDPDLAAKDQFILTFLNQPISDQLAQWAGYTALFLTTQNTVRTRILSAALLRKYPEFSEILSSHAQKVQRFTQDLALHQSILLTESFAHLVSLFSIEYTSLKKRHALVDYDDLIANANTLFQASHYKPWIFYKLDGGIDHILVDEAQDTSQEQWDFLKSLVAEFFSENMGSKNRTLFVVGDAKQSIYSFQGACLISFDATKLFFQEQVEASGQVWQSVHLATSYRSTEPILHFINTLFQETPFLPAYQKHQAHRLHHPGYIELWPLVSNEEQEKIEAWDIDSYHQRKREAPSTFLAHQIAQTIQSWLQSGKELSGHHRPIRPSDILILVRHRNAFFSELIQALNTHKIPCSGADRINLLSELMIQDLLILGDFCLLPEDDLTLATLLKGPLFNYSEESLLHLCAARSKQSLWSFLSTQLDQFETRKKLSHLQEIFNNCAESPLLFYSSVLSESSFRSLLLKRFGQEKEEVLEEFLEQCHLFEQSETLSFQAFQIWIKKNSVELKKQTTQADIDRVQILTVHGAKGLQAPIVFLPDTTQTPSARSFFYHIPSLTCPLWAPHTNLKKAAPAKEEDLSEYYRLLYVALTRAEDQLYLCGYASTALKDHCWYTLLDQAIKKIGSELSDGPLKKWVYGEISNQFTSLPTPSQSQGNVAPTLPSWVYQPFPLKNIGKNGVQQTPQQEKGTLIHTLFQWLSKTQTNSEKLDLIKRHLHTALLTPLEKNEILSCFEKILFHPQCNTYIPPHTLAEFSVHGFVNGQPTTGVIDALTVDHEKKHLIILDYKTGVFKKSYLANPPLAYTTQLETYAQLLAPLYPDFSIQKVILWIQPALFQVV